VGKTLDLFGHVDADPFWPSGNLAMKGVPKSSSPLRPSSSYFLAVHISFPVMNNGFELLLFYKE
jgi:hypothetical protein